MSKVPFEKIRSVVDRRKLFEGLCLSKQNILFKGEGDQFFEMKNLKLEHSPSLTTVTVQDYYLSGTVHPIEIDSVQQLARPQGRVHCLGNFSVDADRFFFNGKLQINGDHGILPIACDVFRFQRRSHMRLQVRPEIDIFLALTEHNGKSIYQVAHLADISASGARIYFGNIHGTSFVDGPSKNPGLEIGQVFRAVLHPPSGKCIDLKVQVRHSLKTKGDQASMTQFGVEFIDLPPVLKNRLAAMMMDLQYKILREFELTF